MGSFNVSMTSYVSPKIEIKDSHIHKLGMFAKQTIEKGEVTFIKGGHILSRSEIHFDKTINSYLPIDDHFFIGATHIEEEDKVKLFNNHSCEPNCGIRGEITFVALRRISPGEELTCDYATIDNEDYQFRCNCMTDSCRGIITGFDWKLPQIQAKYAGFFARYLSDRISRSIVKSKTGKVDRD